MFPLITILPLFMSVLAGGATPAANVLPNSASHNKENVTLITRDETGRCSINVQLTEYLPRTGRLESDIKVTMTDGAGNQLRSPKWSNGDPIEKLQHLNEQSVWLNDILQPKNILMIVWKYTPGKFCTYSPHPDLH